MISVHGGITLTLPAPVPTATHYLDARQIVWPCSAHKRADNTHSLDSGLCNTIPTYTVQGWSRSHHRGPIISEQGQRALFHYQRNADGDIRYPMLSSGSGFWMRFALQYPLLCNVHEMNSCACVVVGSNWTRCISTLNFLRRSWHLAYVAHYTA